MLSFLISQSFYCLFTLTTLQLNEVILWNKGEFFKDLWLLTWCMWILHVLTFLWFWFLFFFILWSPPLLPTQTSSKAINPWKVHLIHNFYFCAAQALICCPFFLADLHLFNWAVCQKARPAWVIEAFMYLHSWHSLCISSVGWGFPEPMCGRTEKDKQDVRRTGMNEHLRFMTNCCVYL